jgi:hypothetical protein
MPVLRASRIAISMKRVLAVTFCGLFLSSCGDHQKGYTHRGTELTQEDRYAIKAVEDSPLGKRAIMRPLFDYVGGSSPPLSPCNYWVTKVIERNATKYDGKYPEHYTVTCFSSVSGVSVDFEWKVRDNTVISFQWGTAPDN